MLGLESLESRVEGGDVDVIRSLPEARRGVLTEAMENDRWSIARYRAVCGMRRTGVRHDDGVDAGNFRILMRVRGASSAIRHQDEVARVEACTQRHSSQQVGHLVVGDFANAGGRLCHVHSQRLGDILADRLMRSFDIQAHLTAEEILRVDDAQHHIGIGDRRLDTASPVAGRTRRRARAFGANREVTVLHAGDRSAARTDGGHLDRRQGHVETPFLAHRLEQRLTVDDQADIEAGAAHVGGQDVLVAQQLTELL